jgi:hypothetical protein
MPITQTIEEFEELIPESSVIGICGIKKDIKSFLLSSHLSYLEEEVKRLEGEKHTGISCDCESMGCIWNSAIQQQIDLKKKEIEEIKKML